MPEAKHVSAKDRRTDHRSQWVIKRKGVAMYLGLFVMGCLLVLASQVVRTGGEDHRHSELAVLIANAESIKAESQSLLEELKSAGDGEPDFLAQLLDYELEFKSVDARIGELVSQLPGEVLEEQERQQAVAEAELKAEARAAGLAASMRPRVAKAFALIRATIAKAALQGLVRVESVSDPSLPEPVMMTAYQLRGRPRSLKDSGLVVSFGQNWKWTIYVELGQVRSPRGLAEWSEQTDLSYPALRISEGGATLATVAFDPKTADLTMTASDDTSRFGQALNALKREHQQEELVANAILDLLQDAKDRQSAT